MVVRPGQLHKDTLTLIDSELFSDVKFRFQVLLVLLCSFSDHVLIYVSSRRLVGALDFLGGGKRRYSFRIQGVILRSTPILLSIHTRTSRPETLNTSTFIFSGFSLPAGGRFWIANHPHEHGALRDSAAAHAHPVSCSQAWSSFSGKRCARGRAQVPWPWSWPWT